MLVVASVNSQSAIFRVTDINLLPYPGVTVGASSESADPVEGVTNSDGYVVFQWPDGSGSIQATIVGTSVTVTATSN